MKNDENFIIDEVARTIFEVLQRNGRLKPPAAIAVMQGLSGGPRRRLNRSATTWQDYRPEARRLLKN